MNEMTRLIEQLKAEGYTVSKTSRGHWKVHLPGQPSVIMGSKGGDWRAVKNARARLRRAGVSV